MDIVSKFKLALTPQELWASYAFQAGIVGTDPRSILSLEARRKLVYGIGKNIVILKALLNYRAQFPNVNMANIDASLKNSISNAISVCQSHNVFNKKNVALNAKMAAELNNLLNRSGGHAPHPKLLQKLQLLVEARCESPLQDPALVLRIFKRMHEDSVVGKNIEKVEPGFKQKLRERALGLGVAEQDLVSIEKGVVRKGLLGFQIFGFAGLFASKKSQESPVLSSGDSPDQSTNLSQSPVVINGRLLPKKELSYIDPLVSQQLYGGGTYNPQFAPLSPSGGNENVANVRGVSSTPHIYYHSIMRRKREEPAIELGNKVGSHVSTVSY